MTTYEITTAVGTCVCYEVSGIYYPLHEYECDKFLFEPILNIQRIEPVAY